MKKIILSFAVITSALFASCSKDDVATTAPEITNPTSSSEVRISLVNSTVQTRGFLEDMFDVQQWEEPINFVTMYAFDEGQELVTKQRFDSSSIINGTISLHLPNIGPKDGCVILAVANIEIPTDVSSYQEIVHFTEQSTTAYNGNAADVITGDFDKANNFTMTGSNAITMNLPGVANTLTIEMVRTVAKMAIQTVIAPELNASVRGQFVLKSVTLHNTANQTVLFDSAPINSGAMQNTTNQTPIFAQGEYRNLLYLFEREANMIDVTFNIAYDEDGDLVDDSDQTSYAFSKRIPNTLKRNTYYKVTCNIGGEAMTDPIITFDVVDWSTGESNNFNEDIFAN